MRIASPANPSCSAAPCATRAGKRGPAQGKNTPARVSCRQFATRSLRASRKPAALVSASPGNAGMCTRASAGEGMGGGRNPCALGSSVMTKMPALCEE
jgi:hypothetical protein